MKNLGDKYFEKIVSKLIAEKKREKISIRQDFRNNLQARLLERARMMNEEAQFDWGNLFGNAGRVLAGVLTMGALVVVAYNFAPWKNGDGLNQVQGGTNLAEKQSDFDANNTQLAASVPFLSQEAEGGIVTFAGESVMPSEEVLLAAGKIYVVEWNKKNVLLAYSESQPVNLESSTMMKASVFSVEEVSDEKFSDTRVSDAVYNRQPEEESIFDQAFNNLENSFDQYLNEGSNLSEGREIEENLDENSENSQRTEFGGAVELAMRVEETDRIDAAQEFAVLSLDRSDDSKVMIVKSEDLLKANQPKLLLNKILEENEKKDLVYEFENLESGKVKVRMIEKGLVQKIVIFAPLKSGEYEVITEIKEE